MRPREEVSTMKLLICILGAGIALNGLARWSAAANGSDERPEQNRLEKTDRPFLAVWRDNGGRISNLETPCLRFAIWSDGRVLFAKDPKKWAHDLRRAKVTDTRVARLKAALSDTSIFDLKGNCYLVPDKPMDCLMVDLREKKQML